MSHDTQQAKAVVEDSQMELVQCLRSFWLEQTF